MTAQTRVLDLVDRDVTGVRAQVRQRYDYLGWEPMWRTLKTAERRKVKNAQWVYLTWEKEGAHDCGYSGRTLDIADDWMIDVENA